MISYIEGKIILLQFNEKVMSVDILTNGGVGYRVRVQPGDFLEGEQAKLFTSFKVREDSQELYGFKDKGTRDFFERLLSVSGVGPKTAMVMLSTNSVEKISSMIEEGDYKALSKTPGIGEKSAKKIIVELQGKLDLTPSGGKDPILSELSDALKALGYNSREVGQMIEKAEVMYKEDSTVTIEKLIQAVLN
ncbi:MAG: Holliday junction branch migration protein RuvA [Candidatus Dojkabacteria bacterium]|nr:MAG: Holliday junction branch migration protein RuvA [Candidatus Dojkabacteria bacterium]